MSLNVSVTVHWDRDPNDLIPAELHAQYLSLTGPLSQSFGCEIARHLRDFAPAWASLLDANPVELLSFRFSSTPELPPYQEPEEPLPSEPPQNDDADSVARAAAAVESLRTPHTHPERA